MNTLIIIKPIPNVALNIVTLGIPKSDLETGEISLKIFNLSYEFEGRYTNVHYYPFTQSLMDNFTIHTFGFDCYEAAESFYYSVLLLDDELGEKEKEKDA